MYHQLTFYRFLDYSCVHSFLRSEQQYAERKVVGKLLLRSCVGYVEHMRHIPYTKHMWPKRMWVHTHWRRTENILGATKRDWSLLWHSRWHAHLTINPNTIPSKQITHSFPSTQCIKRTGVLSDTQYAAAICRCLHTVGSMPTWWSGGNFFFSPDFQPAIAYHKSAGWVG